jgi:hypothetical protein
VRCPTLAQREGKTYFPTVWYLRGLAMVLGVNFWYSHNEDQLSLQLKHTGHRVTAHDVEVLRLNGNLESPRLSAAEATTL